MSAMSMIHKQAEFPMNHPKDTSEEKNPRHRSHFNENSLCVLY